MGSALRLINSLSSRFQTPILLGGLAINNCSDEERKRLESTGPNVTLIVNSTIDSLIKTVKLVLKNHPKNKKLYE